jgi:uncharacterized membrane protein
MKKYFLTGLVILLPIAITIAVIDYLIDFFTTPFVHFVSSFLKTLHLSELVTLILSKLLILVCLFLFILGLGMLTRWFVVRSIVNLGDRILHKIPVINTVYKTTKEIIRSIFTSDTNAFKQVVLVPFPRQNIWALGLISGDAPLACSTSLNTQLVSVLIPTTPSPISGFLLMYKPEELIYLDMKPEQAIKYIVSCGALAPEPTSLP